MKHAAAFTATILLVIGLAPFISYSAVAIGVSFYNFLWYLDIITDKKN